VAAPPSPPPAFEINKELVRELSALHRAYYGDHLPWPERMRSAYASLQQIVSVFDKYDYRPAYFSDMQMLLDEYKEGETEVPAQRLLELPHFNVRMKFLCLDGTADEFFMPSNDTFEEAAKIYCFVRNRPLDHFQYLRKVRDTNYKIDSRSKIGYMQRGEAVVSIFTDIAALSKNPFPPVRPYCFFSSTSSTVLIKRGNLEWEKEWMSAVAMIKGQLKAAGFNYHL
jgi:hypothetical protein